jgi:hypothetical protein
VVGRLWLARGLERAGEFAEPDGWAVPWPDGLALAPDALVPDALVPDPLAGAELSGLDRCAADRRLEAAVAEWWLWVAGVVAGLNVATDSMAPATRQTARMLASSGMTVPCPAKGPASLRSWRRRRWARSSRW